MRTSREHCRQTRRVLFLNAVGFIVGPGLVVLGLATDDESIRIYKLDIDVLLFDSREFTMEFVCRADFSNIELWDEGSMLCPSLNERIGGVQQTEERREVARSEAREQAVHGADWYCRRVDSSVNCTRKARCHSVVRHAM